MQFPTLLIVVATLLMTGAPKTLAKIRSCQRSKRSDECRVIHQPLVQYVQAGTKAKKTGKISEWLINLTLLSNVSRYMENQQWHTGPTKCTAELAF